MTSPSLSEATSGVEEDGFGFVGCDWFEGLLHRFDESATESNSHRCGNFFVQWSFAHATLANETPAPPSESWLVD